MPADAIDAVLPLTLRDLPRAELLLTSLERFARGLDTLSVVVPDAQLAEIEAGLRAFIAKRVGVEGRASVAGLSEAGPAGFRLQLVPELQLAPELALFPRLGGWSKQQLIKLAMGQEVTRPFFLTLDADVVATRPLSPGLLLKDGKAPCGVDHADLHPRWYRDAEAMLRQPLARGGISHNVTPALLSRAGVRALAEHFGACYAEGRFGRGALRAMRQRYAKLRFGGRPGLAAWRLLLTAGFPWTEYSLYYSFLEAKGLFERFHFESERSLYDGDRSVWFVDDFDAWDPAPLFAGEGPPYFVVLQSNTGVPIEAFSEKLAAYLS